MLFAIPHAGAAFKYLKVGMEVPEFSLKTLEGQEYTLAQVKGQPATLVVFFATWSPRSTPALEDAQKLAAQYADKGFRVLAVNVNRLSLGPDDRRQIEELKDEPQAHGADRDRRRPRDLQRLRRRGDPLDRGDQRRGQDRPRGGELPAQHRGRHPRVRRDPARRARGPEGRRRRGQAGLQARLEGAAALQLRPHDAPARQPGQGDGAARAGRRGRPDVRRPADLPRPPAAREEGPEERAAGRGAVRRGGRRSPRRT